MALWIFPIVVFPHPGTNDAIWLAEVQFLTILLVWIGLLTPGDRHALRTAAASGIAGAAVVAAWILVRGARDWLLAPYGFDELAVILVVGAGLLTVRRLTHG